MENLQAFRDRIQELYKLATPFDGRKPNQTDLAHAIGLNRSELSNRLNGTKGAKLTPANVRAIVRTLVEWEAISTQAEVRELLDMVGCPDYTPAEWLAPPLDLLTPSPSFSKNGHQPPEPEPPPNNLPAALTSFIAREEEMAEVIRRLRSGPSQTRLLTLTGAGGCGKTRLAVEVATRLAPLYAGGTWLVELASLSDEALVPQAVARVVGVREVPGEPMIETLARRLAGKTMLLLLDNCEHLVGGVARLVQALLRACPRLQILATRRHCLNIRGETIWSVPPLALPRQMGTLTPAQLLDYAAIQLFVARAQDVKPTFILTSDNATAVWTICDRLDGIPLAIELATAHSARWTPAQIQQKLDERFAWLPDGNSSDLPHHKTLRAMVDWSYALLTAVEQLLFKRLSVFAGGFTLETAETICADAGVPQAQIDDLLWGLVNKSLVLKEEQDSSTRYRLHDTLRQYGAYLLSEEETADLRSRHLAWFLALAEEMEPLLRGPEQKHSLDLLETEHDNLRAALAWSMEAPEHGEEGLRLGCALREFWERRDYLGEGRRWLDELLDHDRGAAAFWRGRVLYAAGNLADAHDDEYRAQELLEECLALRRTLPDLHRVTYTLDSLGRVLINLDDYARARTLLEESRQLKRELGDTLEMVLPTFYLGRIAHYQGAYEEAKELLEEAQTRSREVQNHQWLAATLYELGAVYEDECAYGPAEMLFAESLRIASELNERGLIGRFLYALGSVAYRRGDYDQASAYYRQTLDLVREREDREDIALVYYGQAALAQRDGQYEEAVRLYSKSLSLIYALPTQRLIPQVLEALADLTACLGQHIRAARLLGAATRLRQHLGTPIPRADRACQDQLKATVRAALSPACFDQAWQAGRVLALDQAIQEALAPIDVSEPHKTPLF